MKIRSGPGNDNYRGPAYGRMLQCELLLNHPAVSRAHAGIKQIDGTYYVFSLRSSNPAILNGKPVEENEALAAGDALRFGPFQLDIDVQDASLVITVSLRIGSVSSSLDVSNPELSTIKLPTTAELKEGKKPAASRPAPIAVNNALDIFWDKRIREAGKIVRPSALFPRSQRRVGKAQFNWIPTTDLVSKWPISFFIWGGALVAVLTTGAAFSYTSAFAPAPISRAHAKSQLEMFPPIAVRPNGDSCTGCHSLRTSMDGRCSACHQTEAFSATVIKPHEQAGIGCVACHAEHRGVDFKPGETALATCTECHSDGNKQSYNGRRLGTPHGGTFGYPVVKGEWTWKGLDNDEWASKQISVSRLATDGEQEWRSKQFHSLHVQRVRVIGGLKGNSEGELSCSSCHKSFNPLDRETPRTTCAVCHNGRIEALTNRVLIASLINPTARHVTSNM